MSHPIPKAELKAASDGFKRNIGWALLSRFLEAPIDLATFASRAAMKPERIQHLLLKAPEDLEMRDVSDMAIALGCELDFSVRKRGSISPRKPRYERFWTPRQRNLRWRPKPTMTSPVALAWVAQSLKLLHAAGFHESIATAERALRWSQSDKLDAANVILRKTRLISHPSLTALRQAAEAEASRRGTVA